MKQLHLYVLCMRWLPIDFFFLNGNVERSTCEPDGEVFCLGSTIWSSRPGFSLNDTSKASVSTSVSGFDQAMRIAISFLLSQPFNKSFHFPVNPRLWKVFSYRASNFFRNDLSSVAAVTSDAEKETVIIDARVLTIMF